MMMNWCHHKILFPVNLNEITCTITDAASKTKSPPVIAKTISCLVTTPTAPKDPPSANEPVSPINIFAGGALNQRKPIDAPIIAPQKALLLPLPLLCMELINIQQK